MKNTTLFILTMLLPFLSLACSSSNTTDAVKITDKIDTEIFDGNPGLDIEIVEIADGSYGDTFRDQNIAIRSEKEYKSFWKELYEKRDPTPKRPSIDFSKNILLFTIRKQKPTGGYATQISKAVKTDNELAVKITNTDPGDNCMTTQALTTPFQLVKVKKVDKPIKFYEKTVKKDCN